MKSRTVLIVSLFVSLLASGAFYWYELRPSKIKHDCSWVKVVEDAVPARQAMTEKELSEIGYLQDCDSVLSKDKTRAEGSYFDPEFEKRREEIFRTSCEQKNKQTIEDYSKTREEIPAKENWRKANDKEYQFCLRDKGL